MENEKYNFKKIIKKKKGDDLVKNNLKNYVKRIINNPFLIKRLSTLKYNFTILFKKTNKKEKDLYDYKKIINNKKFFCNEIYRANSFYGISNCLRNYSNFNKKIFACVEHGLYFGNFINEYEAINSGLPAIVTFGKKRKEILKKMGCNKIIIEVGPYIYYSKSILSIGEIKKEKAKNGKTLLVFPSHSIDDSNTKFDTDYFINSIESIKEKYNYNTVIVCLYYKDIELGRDDIYLKKGYKVVTAGRREDPNFLSRQRTIILLSDFVLSNSVGTHVGYSIALNKPHMIIKQSIKHDAKNKKGQQDIKNTNLNSYKIQKNEVYKAFSEYNEVITKSQMDICNKYWGLNMVKTPEQLNNIFMFCYKISKEAKYNEKNFNRAYTKVYKEINSDSKRIIDKVNF